ncbi:MAG TPA: sugar transferase, partial [bacterium]|nr:sugar transferase [bacterium]
RIIIQCARNNPHYGQEIIGVLAKNAGLQGSHLQGVGILGSSGQPHHFIRELKPDRVILVDTGFSRSETADLVELCEDQWIDFKIVADFFGMMTRHVDVEHVSAVPLLGFRSLPLEDVWNRSAKRFFDLAVSLIGIFLSSPVLILTALLVKLDDGGPVFYRQERVGRDEKVFDLIKFRTMKVDAEKETGPVWAKPNDNRRTRVGNFLRRANLDELPQLFNVLNGNMSLVGPRPERPHFVRQFRASIPRYITRHKIKSGITGWAQVNGFRGNTSIQERLKYDLYYMENWSLIFDVEILFMTFFAAKAYRNAY